MPVEGLPSTVELLLNNLLQGAELSSYKIAGNSSSTTIVLRFSEAMANQSLATPSRCVTPGQWRRKPPSQLRRDQERHNNFRNEWSTRHSTSTPTSGQSQISACAPTPSVTFDSGHVSSLTISDTDKKRDTQKCSATTAKHIQDEKISTEPARGKSTHEIDSDSSMSNETSHELDHCSTDDEGSLHDMKSESTEEDRQKVDGTRTSENIDIERRKEQQVVKDQLNSQSAEDNNSNVDVSILGYVEQRKQFTQYSKTLPSQIKQKLMDKTTNRRIKKAVHDHRVFSVIAETEDLIIEYNFETKEISDWIAKDHDMPNRYLTLDNWRLQRWPDQSKDPSTIETVERCVAAIRYLISM